jgi:hypothetical protein
MSKGFIGFLNNTGIIVFIITFLFFSVITHDQVFLGGNDASRFAQIESLVDFKKANINDSRYSWTVDRVTINGKDYSNKPPFLSIAGAGIYYLLQFFLGISFAKNASQTVYLLTLLMTGGLTSALAVLFYKSLQTYRNITISHKVVLTIALVCGTILTSFATTFNNHVIAAAFLFAAFQNARAGCGLRAGLFVSLTLCIDIVPGIVFIPFLSLMVLKNTGKRDFLKYCLAVLAGIIIFISANFMVVTSPLPPKMVPGAEEHCTNFNYDNRGVNLNVPFQFVPQDWFFPIRCILGWHGFLSVSPVLIFGLFGLLIAIKKGHVVSRFDCILTGTAMAILTAGHVLFINSLGGWSYGYRYLIPIIPILLFFAPEVFSSIGTRLFKFVLVISVILALIGAYNPWPPVSEPEKIKKNISTLIKNPVAVNSGAFIKEILPGHDFSEVFASLSIHPNKQVRDMYLNLFYKSKRYEADKIKSILEK